MTWLAHIFSSQLPSPQPSPAPTFSVLNYFAKAGEGFFGTAHSIV